MTITRFRDLLTGERSSDEEVTLKNWRIRIFTIVSRIGASVGLLAYLANIITLVQQKNWVMVNIVTIAYFLIITVALIKKIPFYLRAASFIFILYTLGIATNLTTAVTGDSRIWLITAAIFSAVFLGGKAGIAVASINLITWLLMGFLFRIDILNYPYKAIEELIQPNNFSLWFNTGITALIASLATIASISAVLNNLNTALQQSRSLTDELAEKASQLQEQAAILRRRSQILEKSAQISRTVSRTLDPDQILHQTAKLVNEELNLLHTGIFLIGKSATTVSLQASSGDRGQTIPAPGYRIPLGQGLINWVITNSQSRSISENEDTAPPLTVKLADSRSHAVVLIQTREKILGVLVLQSQEPHIFGANMMTTLQLMTDQIASQFENAQLFAERESALEAERRAYREASQTDWKEFALNQPNRGYRRDQYGIKTIQNTDPQKGTEPTLKSIPIEVRGQVIGYIDAQKPVGATSWTSTEQELLKTLTGRLASALDTARLYEETQQSAAEEQLISKVTARMRETLDIETVLQTAAKELRNSLDLAEVEVRMGKEPISKQKES